MSSTAAPAAAGGGGSCGGGGESYVAMRAAKAAKQQAHHAQQQQHVGGLPGARRGGLTDHIAGPHLIPNVGREAMVAAQVVCRRHRPPPKKPAEPPAPKGKTGGGGGSSTAGAKEKKRRRNPSEPRPEARGGSRERRSSMSPRRSADRSKARSTRSRSRSRIQSRSASPQRSLSSDTVARKPPPPPPKEKPPEPAPPRDEPALTAAEVRKREAKDLQEYREAEKRRAEEEKRKLQELEQARQKARELQESRKKKLGGAFALEGQDDEEEDPAEREKVARELARTTRKVGTRPPETQGAAGDSGAAMLPYAQSVSSALVPQGAPAASEGVKVAATDIDGRLHDHKFSRVWKDWDASKRDDPGEVARQFMKIAAIKRRGVDPRSSRRRSRSRS